MKNIALVLCLSMTFGCACGQQPATSVASIYDSALVHQYSSGRWMAGEKFIKRKELRALLAAHPASSEELKKHKKAKNIERILHFVALGAYVSSFFILENNPDAALGMLGGSAAVALGSIPVSIKADRGLHRAVWLYNRSVLTGSATSP